MSDAPLQLPLLLAAMIRDGRWPGTYEEEIRQNLESRVSAARLALATGGDEGEGRGTWLYLHSPPFRTVAQRLVDGERDFWVEFGDLGSIDAELSLVLGDFGLGSDAPFILDYRASRAEPSVLRLTWRGVSLASPQPRWVSFARSFEALVQSLGL